ncbi:MAG: hypothetical protein GTN73_02555 [Candidatus Aminicenantes bacterium]|nr:hypothetical protein [Candidatus Aminicenantes bacterium]
MIIPETAKEESLEAEVIAIRKGCISDERKVITLTVKKEEKIHGRVINRSRENSTKLKRVISCSFQRKKSLDVEKKKKLRPLDHID